MNRSGLVWFENNLRVQDNEALYQATRENEKVIACYFFDPRKFDVDKFGFKKTEKFRAQFLIESVLQLKNSLQQLHIPLYITIAKPENNLPHIVSKHNIDTLYTQQEWTTEEQDVRKALKQKLPALRWVETYDQFLFHPEDLTFTISDTPNIFTHFRKICEKNVAIRPLQIASKLAASNFFETNTHLPTLEELGCQNIETEHRNAFPFQGGEYEALKRIENYFWNTKNLSKYKKTRNGLIGKDYSSKLSPWLANGSVSPRTIYFEVKQYEKEVEKNQDTYWLVFELIWRDYFKYISLKHKEDIFRLGGILNKDYAWDKDPTKISKWINGLTEEPFVNANMIELKNTGWMSNRGRQNVASYFAKHQTLDWRIGAAYFESLLIDYDVHSNYGNWMYVAGVGNDPRDRVFNIARQAERYDPQQKYQQLWLQPRLF